MCEHDRCMDTLVFAPYHLIDHTGVALDDLDDLIGHVLIHIIRHRNAQITVLVHLHSHVHCLKQMVAIDTSQDEVAFVQSLGALGASADAHGRERMANAGEEAALLRQCAGVGHHAEGIHLKAVIIMESQRLMLNDALIQLKAALLQTLPASGMAGVQNGHIVLLSHLVDGREQRGKILLRVDVLLAMRRQQLYLPFSSPRRAWISDASIFVRF